MLAYKYFNNNENLLNEYLLENCPEEAVKDKNLYIKPISQLELPLINSSLFNYHSVYNLIWCLV